jgi:Exoribonuclease R
MNDLHAVAVEALGADKFAPELDAAASQQLKGLQPPAPPADAKDLRHLLWSSIDNTESKDLDQIEYAEELPDKGMRLLVGIADVDVLIAKGSPLDAHAMTNSTSVYTGVDVFPMLPSEISTGLTSLNEGVDRVVLVIEVCVNADGSPRSHAVYRAIAANRAKLAYESVGPWLEGRGERPRPSPPITISRRSCGCRTASRVRSRPRDSKPALSSSIPSRRPPSRRMGKCRRSS